MVNLCFIKSFASNVKLWRFGLDLATIGIPLFVYFEKGFLQCAVLSLFIYLFKYFEDCHHHCRRRHRSTHI